MGCFSSPSSSRDRTRVCLRVRDATFPSSSRFVVCLFDLAWLIAAAGCDSEAVSRRTHFQPMIGHARRGRGAGGCF